MNPKADACNIELPDRPRMYFTNIEYGVTTVGADCWKTFISLTPLRIFATSVPKGSDMKIHITLEFLHFKKIKLIYGQFLSSKALAFTWLEDRYSVKGQKSNRERGALSEERAARNERGCSSMQRFWIDGCSKLFLF